MDEKKREVIDLWYSHCLVSQNSQYWQVAEQRRKDRPQHLQELLKMDLDTAPVRDLRAIMIKMGIPYHDCVEKSDMKERLIDRVPELRMEIERKASAASISTLGSSPTDSRPPSVSSGLNFLGDPLGASEDSRVRELEEKNKQLEEELKKLKRRIGEKESEIDTLEMQMRKMTARANDAESQVLAARGSAPIPKV